MKPTTESVYELLVNEEERLCADISDEACRETPRNFFIILLTYILTKLSDALANTKTVLPWALSSIAAPAFFTGLLVPIREAGSLLPQIILAAQVRRLAVRKWAYSLGCIAQALCMTGIALVVWFANDHLDASTAGWCIVALLILFSLARGLCSIAAKDVLGKTVPKRRRGRLTGWSSSAAGLITVIVGFSLILLDTTDYSVALLIAGAACLWMIAAAVYSTVREFPSETEGGANALPQALQRSTILASDRDFRHFVLVRALLLSSALAGPYYIVLAQQYAQQTGAGLLTAQLPVLGLFVLAAGGASLISAPLWGKAADRSSRNVMLRGSLLTIAVNALLVAVNSLDITRGYLFWLPALYFVLSIAHAGIRVGRKTYVVDLAKGNRRTDYVAVGNTAMGVILLLVGLLSAALSAASITLVLALFTVMPVLAVWLCWRLPDVTGAQPA